MVRTKSGKCKLEKPKAFAIIFWDKKKIECHTYKNLLSIQNIYEIEKKVVAMETMTFQNG